MTQTLKLQDNFDIDFGRSGILSNNFDILKQSINFYCNTLQGVYKVNGADYGLPFRSFFNKIENKEAIATYISNKIQAEFKDIKSINLISIQDNNKALTYQFKITAYNESFVLLV